MRKVSVGLVAAAVLFVAGGAQKAQAASLPVNVINLNCETVEQWKDKLGWKVNCDWLEELLNRIECGDTPGTEVPEQPEETPEVSPEEQNQAYVYGMRITELVNEHRAAAGLAPVEYSVELSRAAQTRAYEIETSFSHTRPNGSNFSTVLKEQGISYRYSGENIAWGQKSPEEVVNAWMNSAGHRANILSKSFTKLGVGYQQNARGVNYFTQLFTN